MLKAWIETEECINYPETGNSIRGCSAAKEEWPMMLCGTEAVVDALIVVFTGRHCKLHCLFRYGQCILPQNVKPCIHKWH